MTQMDADQTEPRHRLTVQMILTPAESRRLRDAEGDADRETAIIRELVATHAAGFCWHVSQDLDWEGFSTTPNLRQSA